MKDKTFFLLLILFFLGLYFMPINNPIFKESLYSAFFLLHDYARLHVLTCLVPAMFIAGAISIFVKKDVVLIYLGSESSKLYSYSIASVSGSILAVCSCTILPLFASIRKRGAGLGPAITFLFSGPAINIAAIFLTFSVLGFSIGLARVVSAVGLSILVGLSMALIFKEKAEGGTLYFEESSEVSVSYRVLITFFFSLVMILVVNGLTIGAPLKYLIMLLLALVVVFITLFKFSRETSKSWLNETWFFGRTLIPLLFIGVFVAGFIMPLIPQQLIEQIVGKNNILGNLIASIFGAFMYFSTLTEIPILQALISKGMSNGPALALLLSGPSLSLPNMLVIRRVLGSKRTLVYVVLVILYSTVAGLIFGNLVN
ncbi:MAG: permease [Candidatus Methanofastidiosa archaeon]|nr:permease [Candidatus Methanofastidiosa archaeon]